MKTSVRRNLPDQLRCGAVIASVVLAFCTPVFAQTQAQAPAGAGATSATRAQQKKQIIREIIELTDAAQLEAIFSRQFIDRVANAVALFQPNLDPNTMAVVRQEATAVIHEHIESGDALYSVLYPVYEKHFNLVELSKLMDFYQSPVGQKLIRVSPQLLTESLSLGREWGLSLVPEIIDRVQSRLAQGSADAR